MMYVDIHKDAKLDEIWEMILCKLGNKASKISSKSSSFYKTQDGIECSLRKLNGDLVAICYRENNRSNGYRWTIEICKEN